MGEVVPKPLGRFRQYRKSIGLEVQDPDRLLVENLAGGREEVIGRFGAVVVDVSIEYAVLRIRTDVMELCITMGPNLESNSLN